MPAGDDYGPGRPEDYAEEKWRCKKIHYWGTQTYTNLKKHQVTLELLKPSPYLHMKPNRESNVLTVPLF